MNQIYSRTVTGEQIVSCGNLSRRFVFRTQTQLGSELSQTATQARFRTYSTAGLMVVPRAVQWQLAPAGQCWCVMCWAERVCVCVISLSRWVWQHSCCWQRSRQLQRAGTRRTHGYVSTDSSSDSVALLTGRDPRFWIGLISFSQILAFNYSTLKIYTVIDTGLTT